MVAKKILIWGCYGEDNIGDETILQSMITSLRSIDSKISIAVFSSSPSKTAENYMVESILDLNFFKPKHWIGLYLKGECLKIIKRIYNCDILVIGGGELLRDDFGLLPLLGILDKVFIAKVIGKKILGYGLGVGHFKTYFGKIIGKFGINMFDIITTRDSESLVNLNNLNVKKPKCYVVADPAINFAVHNSINSDNGRFRKSFAQTDGSKVIGISLCDKVNGKKQSEMARLWNELGISFGELSRTRRYKFTYIPFQIALSQDDRIPANQIAQFVKAGSMRILNYEGNFYPETIARDIAKIDILVGMRLHSCIIAASLGIPCIGISYDAKVRKFMQEIGLDDYILDIDTFTSDKLLQAVDKISVNYDSVVKYMRKSVEMLQKNEKKNVEAVSLLIRS